jgi:beta-N-acetylhexosaminidase
MTGLLRQRLNFNGVAMTDDLDMQAVSSLIPRWEAVIKAIRAGNDLLMIRNVSDFDPELPRKVVAWVQEAITAGTLSRDQIACTGIPSLADKTTLVFSVLLADPTSRLFPFPFSTICA